MKNTDRMLLSTEGHRSAPERREPPEAGLGRAHASGCGAGSWALQSRTQRGVLRPPRPAPSAGQTDRRGAGTLPNQVSGALERDVPGHPPPTDFTSLGGHLHTGEPRNYREFGTVLGNLPADLHLALCFPPYTHHGLSSHFISFFCSWTCEVAPSSFLLGSQSESKATWTVLGGEIYH